MLALTTLVLAVAALSSCRRAEVPLPSTDTPLAVLDRPLLAGGKLDLASLEGKVVLVNFWSPG